MEVKTRIAEGFLKLAKVYGIKRVTLDELANEIGISKKTIYQHFEDKTAIVQHVFLAELEADKCTVGEIVTDGAKNVIEQFFTISKYFQQEMEGVNPIVIYDLRKFYPSVWSLFTEHKNGFVRKCISEMLEKGKTQGYVREDINSNLTAIIYGELIEIALANNITDDKKFKASYVHANIIELFLYGVCTLKGHKLINKYKNINEDE
jgi:TetR/AcrR family transcriptional regulator, cholesterol catabolism regulator